MSPQPRRERGRGPIFFVVLVVLGLAAITAGALVVLFVFAKSHDAAAVIVDAAAASSSVVAQQPSVSVTARDSVVPSAGPPPALHTPSLAGTGGMPKSAASGGGCLCIPITAPTSSLCQASGIAHCSCLVAGSGASLCTVPWTNDGNCSTMTTEFGGTLTAKDGDACAGHNSDRDLKGNIVNEKVSGHLSDCYVCSSVETYSGKIGTPCAGYRGDRLLTRGLVDCRNLEFSCNRGDPSACAALKTHR